MVKTADGEEKYYITLNKDFVDIQIVLIGLPANLPYADTSTLNLCSIYFDYLNNLVTEAKKKFS